MVGSKLFFGSYLDGCNWSMHTISPNFKEADVQELNFDSCTSVPRKLLRNDRRNINRAGSVIPTVEDHLPGIERGQQGVGIYCSLA